MRRLTPEDAEQVAALEMIIFPENCFNERTLERELYLGRAWGVEGADGELVAYVLLRSQHGLTDVIRLGVRPDYQGRGFGTRLLERAVNTNGELMLTVRKSNTVALRIYRKYGFQIVGVLNEENWVMRRATSSDVSRTCGRLGS